METKDLKKYLPKKSRQNINWCSCSRDPDLHCHILKGGNRASGAQRKNKKTKFDDDEPAQKKAKSDE